MHMTTDNGNIYARINGDKMTIKSIMERIQQKPKKNKYQQYQIQDR